MWPTETKILDEFSKRMVSDKMISRWFKYALVALSVAMLAGCMSHSNLQDPVRSLNQQIVANKILDILTGKFVDESVLIKQLLSSDYLLLGETHDNGHHHDLQAYIIDQLRQEQRSVSVAFEMITYKQVERLEQNAFSSAQELIEILDQSRNNWPYERDYKRVFASALAAGFDILPANLDINRLINISMHGNEALPENIRQILDNTPLSEKHRTDLLDEILLAHCNKLPVEATRPMVEVQRIRDAVMSMSLLNSKVDTRVLIAGAGHTRNDRGVPLYLRSHDKEAGILSVAFLEIIQDANGIETYVQRWGGQALPFDYVWFTPALQRQHDPCDAIEVRGKQKYPRGT